MRLFVYGTLLSPFDTASLIPSDAIRHPAAVIGRMYHYLPGCYPAIAVPGNLIQAKGTVDYLVDETHEMSQDPVSFESFRHIYTNVYHNGFGWIYGELMDITNPCEIFPAIDRYEGFGGNDPLYHRSLIPVMYGDEMTWGWVYHFDESFPFEENEDLFVRVLNGNWLSFLKGDDHET